MDRSPFDEAISLGVPAMETSMTTMSFVSGDKGQ
jgi:hypothetical protein